MSDFTATAIATGIILFLAAGFAYVLIDTAKSASSELENLK